jgi:hypothetical protein
LRSSDKIINAILNLMSAVVLIYNNVGDTISHVAFNFESWNSQMTTMIDGNGKWILWLKTPLPMPHKFLLSSYCFV